MSDFRCPICNSYHDSISVCPNANYITKVTPTIQEDPNWALTWRLDKITTLLEQLLQEVKNK